MNDGALDIAIDTTIETALPIPRELDVVRLGKTDWRVSGAGGELLGYIERQHSDRFEIVWMTDPMHWGYIDSFDGALEAFTDSVRFTGEQSPKRIRDEKPERETTSHPLRRDTWVKAKRRPRVA
jgi:hypothetical protein